MSRLSKVSKDGECKRDLVKNETSESSFPNMSSPRSAWTDRRSPLAMTIQPVMSYYSLPSTIETQRPSNTSHASYPFAYLVEQIQSFLLRFWQYTVKEEKVVLTGSMAMMIQWKPDLATSSFGLHDMDLIVECPNKYV